MKDVENVINHLKYFLIQKKYVQNVNSMFVMIVQRLINRIKHGRVKYV